MGHGSRATHCISPTPPRELVLQHSLYQSKASRKDVRG